MAKKTGKTEKDNSTDAEAEDVLTPEAVEEDNEELESEEQGEQEGEASSNNKLEKLKAFLDGAYIYAQDNKKQAIAFILIALLLIGGLLYLIIGLALQSDEIESANTAEHSKQEKKLHANKPIEYKYLELDEILVGLAPSGEKPNFLKTTLVLQVAGENDLKVVKAQMPMIRDAITLFLKDLRIQDFRTTAATLRIKEELIKRVNIIVNPVKIKDVLIKDIVVS